MVGPPGSGKTVVGAWLAAARNYSTLVLVHRKPLTADDAEKLLSRRKEVYDGAIPEA